MASRREFGYLCPMPRRHLLVFRHAHAERDADSGRDQDRKLSPRGRRDAASMGRLLTAAELVPAAVLTSPAARARETAELAAEAGGWRGSIHRVPSLYQGSVDRVLEVIREHGDDHETLAVVGHDPTWSELAAAVAGCGSLRLSKGAVAHLELDLDDWDELRPGSGVLRALVTPAFLAGLGAQKGDGRKSGR